MILKTHQKDLQRLLLGSPSSGQFEGRGSFKEVVFVYGGNASLVMSNFLRIYGWKISEMLNTNVKWKTNNLEINLLIKS